MLCEVVLNEDQAAEWLSLPVSTLQRWRHEGKGPAWFKLGKVVRYSAKDLQRFLEANRRGGEAA